MKILVPVKRVPDPDQKIRFHPGGDIMEQEQLAYVINPFDAIALEEALRIRQRLSQAVSVVAIGIGNDVYEPQLRTALAMGADRAVLVPCDKILDSWNVANILATVVQRESPDIVLMGKQAIDDDANQAGQFLAALMDWPQATFASRVEVEESGVVVDRETDAGVETVRMPLPAVITTDLRLNEPRYASLPSIIKARQKEIERLGIDELRVTISPRLDVMHVESAPLRRSCTHVSTVDELLQRLRNEANLSL